MAIKVNGTTVINDSRALQNIASVDATTVAALGAAGVGGGGEWTNLGTYTTSYYSCTNTQDTGWIDMSSMLSGLSSTYKLLYIQAVPRVPLFNGSDAGSDFVYIYDDDAFRIGTSSSSYLRYHTNTSYYGTRDVNVEHGFTGKYQYIGGSTSGQYRYDRALSPMMIGVAPVTPPNMNTLDSSVTLGNNVGEIYGHIYNKGSFTNHSTNLSAAEAPSGNVGYFAWRRYNFAGANSIANFQQPNFQVGWVFSAAYYE